MEVGATCVIWPDDAGPCGTPAVERLRYLNEWMDHPGHGQARVAGRGLNPADVAPDPGPALGLPVCRDHLRQHLRDHLLVAGT